MRRIKTAFTDFAIPFCAPKQARFSAALMAIFLLDRSVNFGLGFLCEIGSCLNLGDGSAFPCREGTAGSIEHPGGLLPKAALTAFSADVGQRAGLFLGAVLFGVIPRNRPHNPVAFGFLGFLGWLFLNLGGCPWKRS